MTTLFVATTGGHLTQLDSLASRIPPNGDAVWVTHANEQSQSMLADRDVEFVPYVGVRNVPDVLRCIPDARRLMARRKVTRAVSTGSGIALGYLPYLAARGVECHYIESATRVTGPSLTGRVLKWVPRVHTYTQYQSWADHRWGYAGSVFDGYESAAMSREPDAMVRVVVTVGAATQYPFRRLFEHLVPLLAPDGALSNVTGLPVEVLWQSADTPVDDLPIHATSALPAAELGAALSKANIVISHAGTGSALAALNAGRYPILATRDPARGEQVDDHQQQLATELARRGLAMHRDAQAITIDDMMEALDISVRRTTSPPPFELRH
ncbi:MAG TPA: glycosyltransferase [Pseudonocardiaceae bacterium]|jgi:UDP-N-acetylglucosamine--N-acetylmuramyl-(pentapeptide) pyrophosphoryl-undecaprenol N-acetylglucosamine transferase|nr:glycosyltransferase [Pseudonocardiaceae bacterium]